MINKFTPTKRRELAKKFAISDAYLYQCLKGIKDMNPEQALRIEKESNRVLTRKMLCQSRWVGIWPELARWKA